MPGNFGISISLIVDQCWVLSPNFSQSNKLLTTKDNTLNTDFHILINIFLYWSILPYPRLFLSSLESTATQIHIFWVSNNKNEQKYAILWVCIAYVLLHETFLGLVIVMNLEAIGVHWHELEEHRNPLKDNCLRWGYYSKDWLVSLEGEEVTIPVGKGSLGDLGDFIS